MADNAPPPTNDPALTIRTKPDAGAALIPKPPTAFGLMPSTVDQAWRLATIMAASDLVPKQYKGKPEDVMVAIMYGAEVGLTPAQAIVGVRVINGLPGLYGDVLLAVITSSPVYVTHEEYYTVDGATRHALTSEDLRNPTTTAVCTFWRRGQPEPTTRQFSVADAQRARLMGKAGPWTEYPQRMLRFRALGFAARDLFADVLHGMKSAEELLDSPDAPARDAMPVVRRMSDTPPPAPPDPPAESTALTGRIVNVAPHANGDDAIVTLSTGVRVVVPDLPSAHALAACLTTDRIVHLAVTRGPADELVLTTYRIED